MFSIIVPVYNVESYILDCLNSIKEQTYKDFEVIIVNDGSLDKSGDIINKFIIDNEDERFKLYNKKNGGLSDARNYGVNIATREYLIFLDSDDYWDTGLLSDIRNEWINNMDLEIIRIPKRFVSENKEEISRDNVNEFHSLSGEQAFVLLRENKITLETAPSYAIKLEYWRMKKYSFPVGKLHEDIAVIPRIILESSSISSLAINSFYNYRQRNNSIVNTKNPEIDRKKFMDLLDFYVVEKKYISSSKHKKKVSNIYIQYYADVVLLKYLSISSSQNNNYRDLIIKERVLKDYPIMSLNSMIKYFYYVFKIYL